MRFALAALLLLPSAARAQTAKPGSPSDDGPACEDRVDAYHKAEHEFAGLALEQFGGDKKLLAKAKDGAVRTRDLAEAEIVRCALKAAKDSGACAREFKALRRAEAAYNDPGVMDEGGELLRKATRAAENLESCFSSSKISIPKGFVRKDRYRWTQDSQ